MTGIIIFGAGVVTLCLIYAIFAMILNMEAGWAGLWDLGPSGFIAVGAYTYIILTVKSDAIAFAPEWPMWAGWLGAAATASLAALLIGLLALRLRGEYFLITTFAFSVVIVELIVAQSDITAGASGFNSFDRPLQELSGVRHYTLVLCGIVSVAALVVYAVLQRLAHAPFGRLLRATRDNEPAALSIGKNVRGARIRAFVLAGALFGAAAPLYIFMLRSVYPNMFSATLAFTVWTAVVIGGIGNMRGAMLGAVLLIGVTEATQFLQVSIDYANLLAAMRPVIIGLALILVIRFRPQGLLPESRAFAARTGDARPESPAMVSGETAK
jgi:branched-chain amino acid transport system permease protein